MIFWSRTASGWALNLDGTDAATEYALPRLELRSSSRGWVCACHLADGTTRLMPLGRPGGVAEAKRLALEGSLETFVGEYEADLRALLEEPGLH
jgi:hypothetical protein